MGCVFEYWPSAGTVVIDKATVRAAAAIAELRNHFFIAAISLEGISKRKAFVFQDLSVLLFVTVQEHAHLPRLGKRLRIFDGGFVVDLVGTDGCIALDQAKVPLRVSGPPARFPR
jgi:hypothetical protein